MKTAEGIRLGMISALLLAAAQGAWAQQAKPSSRESTPEERLNDVERLLRSEPAGAEGRASRVSVSPADNAWVLASSALALLMVGPGLALFYGGLVRKKNVLAAVMNVVFLTGWVSCLWFVYGFSVSFGTGTGFFGSLAQHPCLRDVGTHPNPDYAGTIPYHTYMLFQMMFAIVAPALIGGAFAERIKFSAMVLFALLWTTFVYFPLAHMVWGNGGFFNWSAGGRVPVLDFAGGTVVHASAGVSALVCCLVVGKRIGYPKEPMRPHNVVFSVIGAAMMWVGWLGLNSASALNAGTSASSAFVASHFAAASAMVGWTAIEWYVKGKPSALGASSGLLAGLVGVAPAAGFVTVQAAVLIGVLSSIASYLAVYKLKARFGYDDTLDAFGIHGVSGTLGVLLTGLFADALVNPRIDLVWRRTPGSPPESLAGGGAQFVRQAVGAGVAWLVAALGTFIILKLLDATLGLRAPEQDELQGLNLSLHGEEAYN